MDRRLGDLNTNQAPRRPVRPGALSPFVGRVGELRRLVAALTLTAGGKGRTVFLTGESGIGKTRLAREALALANGRGFLALEGRAHSLESGLAYAPFLQAFGPVLRSLDPARLAVLVDGLPDLGRLFTDLRLRPPEPLGDPTLEKTRLFRAVSRLLGRLTHEAPVVLFLDDVHWADHASLELLFYLARGLADQPALLLATSSANALETNRRLRALVIWLQRERLAEEIIVPRLGSDEVEKLVRAILGGEPPNGLLALLDARARGTPLFIEALVAALIDSGNLFRSVSEKDSWILAADASSDLPPTVRRIILEHLERLAPTDRHIVDLIAIMGDSTSYTILRAASGLEEEPLVESLRRLRAAGMVVEGMHGSDLSYGITHPLTMEVAYSALPEAGRRRGHMAAILALERLRPDDVNCLARHYRGAGPDANPDRALTALLAAGEQALFQYANEEAARHFEAALAIIREGRNAKGEGLRVEGEGARGNLYTLNPHLSQLLEWLGEAWERVGKGEAAIAVWNEALAERERAGDAVSVSRLRCRLALTERDRGHIDMAEGHLRAGFGALASNPPCQELADLHYARCYIRSELGDLTGVAKAAAALVPLAKQLTSPRAKAEADLVVASLSLWQNDIGNARERALQGLLIGEQAQDLAICCRAHSVLAVIGLRFGDHPFMRYHAERGLAVAQRLGTPFWEAILLLRLAHASFLSGAWDDALRYNLGATALSRRVGYPHNLAHSLSEQAILIALQGDLSKAEACISEARMICSIGTPVDRHVFDRVDIAEMTFALERGQMEQALHIARGFVSPSVLPGTAAAVSLNMPMGLMLLAEAQAALGDGIGALETARRLTGLIPSDAPYLTALASRAEGLALQASGQAEAAMVCLVRAHEAFSSLQMPFETARSLLEQATAAIDKHPELAVGTAQQSLAIFERLGARCYTDRARRLLREHGISPPATRKMRPTGDSMSARELEIARLVVQGLTSSEIAKRLILSPLTVSNHLHHIYARLKIGSRAALARYVTEAGLL